MKVKVWKDFESFRKYDAPLTLNVEEMQENLVGGWVVMAERGQYIFPNTVVMKLEEEETNNEQ